MRTPSELIETDVNWLKENYKNLSTKKCAEHLELTHSSTSRLLKVHKLFKRSQKTRTANADNAKKQFSEYIAIRHKDAQKIKIALPEQAYALGFLWGDGWLNKANIQTDLYYPAMEILYEDFKNIEPFLDLLCKWKKNTRIRKPYMDILPQSKKMATIQSHDTVMGLFLKNHDYLEKSTVSPTKILNYLSEDLRQYFWRGYIDADGCFYVNKKLKKQTFTICGQKEQKWIEFEKILNDLSLPCRIYQRKNKRGNEYSVIQMYQKEEITKLGNFLYENNPKIGLKRKFLKFQQIKTTNV